MAETKPTPEQKAVKDLRDMQQAIMDLHADLQENFKPEESRVIAFVQTKLKEAASGLDQEVRNRIIAAQEADRGVGSGKVAKK